MASRSKRRRRVLGASCILAALIVASSSFAWFTSKDEVTNRLSANADYGVSIVESFTPPTNWLPGQEVNKDVYAVNTGSIGAYVKEEVSGVLTVTFDKNTFEISDNTIELTEEERYAMEAGTFLAYQPDGSDFDLGNTSVVRPADQTVPESTDFTPSVEGLYVFRRSIGSDPEAATEEEKITFEYAGYYFVPAVERHGSPGDSDYVPAAPAKYYKLSNLTVFPDRIVNDGRLSSAIAGFVDRETTTVDPVSLEYVEESGSKKLVATYDTGNANQAAYLEALARAYDKALHDYQVADALEERARMDLTLVDDHAATGTTGALTDASLALRAAKGALEAALNTQKEKLEAYNQAVVEMNNAYAEMEAAQNAALDLREEIFGDRLLADVNLSNYSADDDTLYGKYLAAQAALAATAEEESDELFKAELAAFFAEKYPTGNPNAATVAQLEEFKAWVDPDSELHDYYTCYANNEIAKYNYETAYKKLFGNMTNTSYQNAPSGSLFGNYMAKYNLYNQKLNAKGTAQTELNNANSAVEQKLNAYNEALEAYNQAYEVYKEAYDLHQKYYDMYEAAEAAYEAAQAAYENAVALANTSLANSDGKIIININLSDNVITANDETKNDKWLLYKNPLVSDKAEFYYTGILEGGETSTKLIDSVELDESVEFGTYVSFDFDLNIALASTQITYDADGNILADAAFEELGAVATVVTPTDIDTALTWE